MNIPGVDIAAVDAALMIVREAEVPETEDPFWYDRAEQALIRILEFLRDKGEE